MNEKIERIRQNPIFEPNKETNSTLGNYIKNGVRHSISHIVRDWNGAKNLDLDRISETRHLHDIANVIHGIAREKIAIDYKLREPHNMDVFRYFTPEND